jgi:hypothetical protein
MIEVVVINSDDLIDNFQAIPSELEEFYVFILKVKTL